MNRGERTCRKKSLSGSSMNWFPGRTPSPPRRCTALTGSVRRRSTSICSPPCGWWRGISVRRRSRAPMRSSRTKTPPCPASCSPPPSTFRPGVHRQRCPVWPGRAGLWASLARSGRRSSAGLRPAPLWSLGGSNGFTPWTSGGSTHSMP